MEKTINKKTYRMKDGIIQIARLGVKNEHLCTVWHKVCMENGFKLNEIYKIRKEFGIN